MSKGKFHCFDLSRDLSVGGQNIDDTAWVQLSASIGINMNRLKITNTSGVQLKLGIGPSGSEQLLCYVPPNGGDIDTIINVGMRLCARAVIASSNANTGDLIIDGYR